MDLMLKALGDAKGLAWVPDWPGAARMGWIALPPGREQSTVLPGPGIQDLFQVGGDLGLLGPTINLTTA